jgi:hypothetical protein
LTSKLWWLKNNVSDVPELAYLKQIGDQDVANGKPPLAYETYMELLLSASLSYDKKLAAPANPKQSVFAASMEAYQSEFGAYTIRQMSLRSWHMLPTSPSGNQSAKGSTKSVLPIGTMEQDVSGAEEQVDC